EWIRSGQTEELLYALALLKGRQAELEEDFRIIPVLLPGGNKDWLPEDLRQATWVELARADDADGLLRLKAGILDRPPPDLTSSETYGSEHCPFRGLQLFDEADADFFFGRAALVDQLVDRLRPGDRDEGGCRFLTLIGASGCGKS